MTPARQQLVERVLTEMRALSSDTDRLDEASAACFGLSRSDARCMDVLSQHGALGAGELATAVGLSYPAVSALLDRMERDGYVTRTHGTADRRRVLVRPTRKAEREAAAVFSGLIRAMAELVSTYADDELRVLSDFLERSRAVLRSHTVEIRGKKRS